MGIPKCARCGAHSYAGEVHVADRSFSLCGYCLPIAKAKIIGFIEDHFLSDEPPIRVRDEAAHTRNVFEKVEEEDFVQRSE